ncbi:hypothetical protein CTEN210_13609 [Chaetoceros tenuissimus]|uniref:Ubiquitin-like protease family profile domain-containing protein n=1 Tax=Chaetoceros tenuissimus TaxID=426638 RepID=A0AAD3D3L7_9STRA|nr:hypothetical protein CTEN210_13609 [Chaetoceros tenuissimus]
MDSSDCTEEGLKRIVDNLNFDGLLKCARKINDGYSFFRVTNKPMQGLSFQENEASDESSFEEGEDVESARMAHEKEEEEEAHVVQEDISQPFDHEHLHESVKKRRTREDQNETSSKRPHISSLQCKRLQKYFDRKQNHGKRGVSEILRSPSNTKFRPKKKAKKVSFSLSTPSVANVSPDKNQEEEEEIPTHVMLYKFEVIELSFTKLAQKPRKDEYELIILSFVSEKFKISHCLENNQPGKSIFKAPFQNIEGNTFQIYPPSTDDDSWVIDFTSAGKKCILTFLFEKHCTLFHETYMKSFNERNIQLPLSLSTPSVANVSPDKNQEEEEEEEIPTLVMLYKFEVIELSFTKLAQKPRKDEYELIILSFVSEKFKISHCLENNQPGKSIFKAPFQNIEGNTFQIYPPSTDDDSWVIDFTSAGKKCILTFLFEKHCTLFHETYMKSFNERNIQLPLSLSTPSVANVSPDKNQEEEEEEEIPTLVMLYKFEVIELSFTKLAQKPRKDEYELIILSFVSEKFKISHCLENNQPGKSIFKAPFQNIEGNTFQIYPPSTDDDSWVIDFTSAGKKCILTFLFEKHCTLFHETYMRYSSTFSPSEDGVEILAGTIISQSQSSLKSQEVENENEAIELSSDEESDEDMPIPQKFSNCDNDAVIAASLNRELNHISRNTSRRLEQEKLQEYETQSNGISPRTPSRDSKGFVKCSRIAIGNQVYFENMKMSYVPKQQNQLFELDLNDEIELHIGAEDIEEIHYYMPCRREVGTDSNSGGDSDESEESTGNESADSIDDEADLKKNLKVQKKRITIDDEEEEEDEEPSLQVVSSDTIRDMIEVDKDIEGIMSQVIALDDNGTDDGDALVHDSSQSTDQIVHEKQNRKNTLCVDDLSDEEVPDTDTLEHVSVENKKCSHDSNDSSAVEEQAIASVDQTMKNDQDVAKEVARLIEGSPELEKIIQSHPVREHENKNELNVSHPDDHLQDIAMNFEDNFEAAKSSTNQSRESNDHVETTSLDTKPDHALKSIVEPTEEADDDIRSHYYLIIRAKPSKENGLSTFTSNKHYFRSMPKTTPTKSALLAKRYIVIESNNQTDFEHLVTFLKKHDTIGMYFTNDNNLLTPEKLEEEIVSLLNFKKPMAPICAEHETALVFPSTLLETELDSVASNLIEPNGKIGQNHESMFSTVAIEEKAPNRKQKNHIITIRGEDYDRLAPGEFLNDTLIDFWISWLIHRMGNVSDQVHVFTTQFYTKLEQEGVESVVSWTAKKNIDIFEKKYVFVPVNKDIHWSLLVIVNPGNIISDDDEEACNRNLEHPYVLFMDSLRAHKKSKLQRTLYTWLNKEAARLRKFDRKDPFVPVTCPVEIAHVPTQDNCWDCGVFVCRYAIAMLHLLDTRIECKLADWRNVKSRKKLIKEYITEREAFDFGMDDIARLREEMAILIQDLHRIYKQKIEEKKTNKKAKKAKKQQIQMQ